MKTGEPVESLSLNKNSPFFHMDASHSVCHNVG